MKSKDDLLLIKLMGKTGVCISQLNKSVLEFLVSKIIDMISKRDFLNVLILWMQELTKAIIDDQHILNFNTITSYIESVKRLSEDYGSNIPSSVRASCK